MSKDNFDPTKPFGIGNGITEYNAQEEEAKQAKRGKVEEKKEEPQARPTIPHRPAK